MNGGILPVVGDPSLVLRTQVVMLPFCNSNTLKFEVGHLLLFLFIINLYGIFITCYYAFLS